MSYINFQRVTVNHLLALTEYQKTSVSLKACAAACRMKLPEFKRILSEAFCFAGEIPFQALPKAEIRKRLEYFFERWHAEGHSPALDKSPPEEYEAPPRLRPCNAPKLHDPAITSQQMECLRQFVAQPNVARAAEALAMNKIKFKGELRKGLYRAAIVVNPQRATTAAGMSKTEQVRLVHLYFDVLASQQITMDDPAF